MADNGLQKFEDLEANSKKPFEEFKENLSNKIKNDIGSMLPEAVVTNLIEKAVHESFFKERQVNVGSSWSSRYETRPSWFVEEVAKAVEPMMREQVNLYIEKHKNEIENEIKKYIEQQNLALIAAGQVSSRVSADMMNHMETIFDRLKNNY